MVLQIGVQGMVPWAKRPAFPDCVVLSASSPLWGRKGQALSLIVPGNVTGGRQPLRTEQNLKPSTKQTTKQPLKQGISGHASTQKRLLRRSGWQICAHVLRGMLIFVFLLALSLVAVQGRARAATCAATGTTEVTPADVYEARMAAKSADGAFDFSTGSLEAAKECADLLNRISSISLDQVAVPGMDEVLAAVRDSLEEAAQETIEEACRYVAGNTSNWARSQLSMARTSANDTASRLAGARVNVANPDLADVIATHRTRLRQGLPTYADLPSLRDLR